MEVNSLSNKISKLSTVKDIELARLEIYSVVIAMILSKDIFKSNKEIKLFVESMGVEVKDYLLRSRSNIFSKVVREIKKADTQQINLCIEIIQQEYKKYLLSEENLNTAKVNKHTSKVSDTIKKEKNTKKNKTNKENYMLDLMKRYSR